MQSTFTYLFDLGKILHFEDLELVYYKIRISVSLLEIIGSALTLILANSLSLLNLLLSLFSQIIYLGLLCKQTKNKQLVGFTYIFTKVLAWTVFSQLEASFLSTYLYSLGSLALYSIQGFSFSLTYLYVFVIFLLLKNHIIPKLFVTFSIIAPTSIGVINNLLLIFLMTIVVTFIFYKMFSSQSQKKSNYNGEEFNKMRRQLKSFDSQLKRRIDEVNSLNQQLTYALKSQDIFLSSVSHELRNPLNVLLGNIEILESQIKDNGFVEIFKSSKVCGEVILNHINNFLDAAKINSESLEITPSLTQVSTFLQKFWASACNDMKRKNLSGIIIIDKQLPSWIEIDNQRLQQILYNLIENSIKFTQKGSIKVRFSWINDERILNRLDSRVLNNDSTKTDSMLYQQERISDTIYEGKEDVDMRDILPNQNDIKYLSRSLSFGSDDSAEGLLDLSLDDNNTGPKGGALKIDVFDNGCGISREFQQKLFHPFTQGDTSLTRQHSGTGLGLYIVKKIIEKMKGELKVNSMEGSGSHFQVLLPAKIASRQENEQEKTQDLNKSYVRSNYQKEKLLSDEEIRKVKKANSSKIISKKVLIVDDIEFNQKILQNFFGSLGFETEFANNGLFALHKYKENPGKYFLITMDIQMPVMDGITASQQIRAYEREKNIKGTPIAIITGNSLTKQQNHYLNTEDMNVKYIFRKPFGMADCKACVEMILSENIR